ncbi:hypothetical protein CDSM653_02589 [Caldanaerobacter subterraneus subsp. pacificus DSM 12653]|uniref:Uncharacterized protein n=1 Tax=Caldanaerobacter subterraneus subsp. pacificus DSM 12653 TaxID=391606 RepID=A0A0F5PID7_9THEO|nr:hypothetical protein CDSM653_02589 [Caldanaerobacter subterraneus subsp. pacificus DSM 12653]
MYRGRGLEPKGGRREGVGWGGGRVGSMLGCDNGVIGGERRMIEKGAARGEGGGEGVLEW